LGAELTDALKNHIEPSKLPEEKKMDLFSSLYRAISYMTELPDWTCMGGGVFHVFAGDPTFHLLSSLSTQLTTFCSIDINNR